MVPNLLLVVFTGGLAGIPIVSKDWPTLTRAPHKEGDARWDGVSQNALDLGPVKKNNIF